MPEIIVARQHRQVMADAQPGKQRIYRADLDAASPAVISKLCRRHVILPVCSKERQSCEPLKKRPAVFGAGNPLQQLLKNQSRGQDRLPRLQCLHERGHLGQVRRRIAPESERPDAGIDEKANRANAPTCSRSPDPTRACP